ASLNATVVPSTLAAWGLVASTQNGATPTNGQLSLGQFNTSPTTITSGNSSPFQLDNAGNLLVNVKAGGAGGGAVFGPTAVGSAAANPPVLAGGTADGTATGAVAVEVIKAGNTAATTDKAVVVADPNLLASVNSPPPLNVNGTPTGWTGLTPGTPQTGTIVGANEDLTSVGGTAILHGTGAVGAGSPRVAVAVDSAT